MSRPPAHRRALAAMFLVALPAAGSWVSAATAPAAGSTPAKAAVAAVSEGGYFKVGFDILAGFPFEPPEPDPAARPGTPPPSAARQIPAMVKAFDGKKVVVTGYMMPLKMEKGLVTELLLVANSQLCCYGATPRINEFIVVKMNAGAGVKALADVPVEFHGTLTVAEVFEEGYLSQIYTLAGEKMGRTATE